MPKMQHALIGVGVMLIDDTQQVLLGKRIKYDESVTWCFPGGKVDEHESFEDAAVRELFEETQLQLAAEQVQVFMLMNDIERDYINLTAGVVCQLDSLQDDLKQSIRVTEPDIFECWQWFALDTLPDNLFPETQVMLDYWLKRHIAQNFKIHKISSI